MLTVREFRVLMILANDPQATVAGIAEGLNVSRFTARAMLESLRREGFLEQGGSNVTFLRDSFGEGEHASDSMRHEGEPSGNHRGIMAGGGQSLAVTR